MSEKQLSVYDEHTERYTKAFEAFSRLFILERPKPEKPKAWHGLPVLMLPFGIIAIFGVFLSAMRTGPIFQKVALPLVGSELALVEAVLAVVVIEVFIVVVRYVMVVASDTDNTIGLRRWMQGGFWLAFGVAIFANVYASIAHVQLIVPFLPILDLLVALAVGICAPIFAFIAGDVLGGLWKRSERRRQILQQEYEAQLAAWQETRDRSWSSRKADYGVKIRVENAPAAVSKQSRELAHRTS